MGDPVSNYDKQRFIKDPLINIEFTYEFAAESLHEGLGALKGLDPGPELDARLARLQNRLLSLGFLLGDAVTLIDAKRTQATNERLIR